MGEQAEFQGFLTVVKVGTISCVVPLGLWKMVVFEHRKICKYMAFLTSIFFIFCFFVTMYVDVMVYASLDLYLILYKYSHDTTSIAFSLYSFYAILWFFIIFHQEEWRKLYQIFSFNLRGSSGLSTIGKIFLCTFPLKLLLEVTDVYIQYKWRKRRFLNAVKHDYLILLRQFFKFSVSWNKFVLAFIILTGLNIFRSHLRSLNRMVGNIRRSHLDVACSIYTIPSKRQQKKLQLIEEHYKMLCVGVACFNEIFAKSLFLFTTATSLIMVTTVHCLIIKSYSIYRNILFLSSPLVDYLILIFIILTCDHLSVENSEFLHSCWKLQELEVFYYRSENPILRRLIKETKRNKIRISVGGFFWIDRTLILRTWSAVTTYLILLLQLKREA